MQINTQKYCAAGKQLPLILTHIYLYTHMNSTPLDTASFCEMPENYTIATTLHTESRKWKVESVKCKVDSRKCTWVGTSFAQLSA